MSPDSIFEQTEVGSSSALAMAVTAEDIDLGRVDLVELEDTLWDTAESEYDARFLYKYLEPDLADFSDAFRNYLGVWMQDEDAHYCGFRHLYSLAFEMPPTQIDFEMAKRRPDFSRLSKPLHDEFQLLTMLAFDELVTVKAYKKEYALYDALGAQKTGHFIRRVAWDEAAHYADALAILRDQHVSRLDEVPALLRRILDFDFDQRDYRATFLFDHADTSIYSADIMLTSAKVICRQLGLSADACV